MMQMYTNPKAAFRTLKEKSFFGRGLMFNARTGKFVLFVPDRWRHTSSYETAQGLRHQISALRGIVNNPDVLKRLGEVRDVRARLVRDGKLPAVSDTVFVPIAQALGAYSVVDDSPERSDAARNYVYSRLDEPGVTAHEIGHNNTQQRFDRDIIRSTQPPLPQLKKGANVFQQIKYMKKAIQKMNAPYASASDEALADYAAVDAGHGKSLVKTFDAATKGLGGMARRILQKNDYHGTMPDRIKRIQDYQRAVDFRNMKAEKHPQQLKPTIQQPLPAETKPLYTSPYASRIVSHGLKPN